MKKFKMFKTKITTILLVFLGVIFALSQNKAFATVEIPDLPINNIYDSTNYLTDSTKEMLQQYNQEQNTKIAIYMVESFGKESIEDVSKKIAKKWNIGEETRTASILIVFAVDTKELRFSLSNNLSTPLSIFKLNKVYNSNKQYLDANDYDNAIFNIVKSFEDELNIQSQKFLSNQSQTYSEKQFIKNYFKFFGTGLLCLILIPLVFTIVVLLGVGLVALSVLWLKFILVFDANDLKYLKGWNKNEN